LGPASDTEATVEAASEGEVGSPPQSPVKIVISEPGSQERGLPTLKRDVGSGTPDFDPAFKGPGKGRMTFPDR